MNCERCGKAPGEIRYAEYAGGKVQKMMVCPRCAQELGFLPARAAEGPGAPPAAAEDPGATPEDKRTCPGCGLTAEEFHRQSLFGCDRCFATFEEDLDLLFKRLHGASLHRGRLPGARVTGTDPVGPERLERELAEAVRAGDFERAARLRERIRRAGREGAA